MPSTLASIAKTKLFFKFIIYKRNKTRRPGLKPRTLLGRLPQHRLAITVVKRKRLLGRQLRVGPSVRKPKVQEQTKSNKQNGRYNRIYNKLFTRLWRNMRSLSFCCRQRGAHMRKIILHSPAATYSI